MKKRIIPIFTYKNNVLVKSVNFTDYRNVNTILPVIRLFNKRNVDEMIFLNLDDTIDYNLLIQFVDEIDYPITYGGGVENIETMIKIFNIGFDKIALNSILYTAPEFAKKAADLFGKQSLVASIDIRKINNEYICFYQNGKINSNTTVQSHIENIISTDSISEIIVTNIDYEGTYKGFDYELYSILKRYRIRILGNGGGCYNEENIINTINIDNIYGLCFSSMFFFQRYTPNDVKKILRKNGLNTVMNLPF